ncbi:MAG TPA: RAMP superfamily CRISPR-associated protein, partial [Acidobacteriota bacterium]|nr:RAMP superfamily CRISPR-associated protein [Acidobacteriota bacterium]
MSAWNDGTLTAIYTLGPVHCGTGQTTGAVDLPIARDSSTDLPILPATSLKGVAREAFEANAADDADEKRV